MSTITVKPLKGESFDVAVQSGDKVEDFKRRIEASKPDFPASLLKLIYAGKVLEDDKLMSSYEIKSGGFVVAMVSKPKVSTPPASASVPGASPSTAASNSVPAATAPGGPATATTPAASAPSSANEAAILQLCDMGFPRDQVERCLRAAFGNADRAVEYLTTGLPAPRARSRSRSPPPAGHGAGHASHGHGDDAGHSHGDDAGHSCGDHECSGHGHEAISQEHGHGHGHGASPLAVDSSDPVLVMLAAAAAARSVDPEAPAGDDDDAADDMADDSGTVELSEVENAAVQRLIGLGFSEEQAVEAYIACDKKEELAANYLFDNQ